MWVIKAKIPAVEGELVVKALNAIMDAEEEEADAAVSPEECDEASKPRATFPQKRVDALCTMAEHYVASAENGIGDLKGSERTQLLLHVDIKTLQKHTSTEPKCCHLDHDNWLHPDTARRLSCDASLVTVLEDDKGNVLNIGRRSRILPSAIKRALDIRDEGCRFPGCGCTRYVDAHHIKHWVDGGETSLGNLITLCRFHHRQLHLGEFSITLDGGEFIFSNRRGIEILPTFRPQFPDQENVSAEILELETIRPEISAETCKTKWAGESLDMDLAIQALLTRDEKRATSRKASPELN
jgi:hypothetical protein